MNIEAERTPTIVYILGPGHCGSTLLNLLLNGHSKIIGLSEMDRINEVKEKEALRSDRVAYNFWCAVDKSFKQLTGNNISDVSLSPLFYSWKKIFNLKYVDIHRWGLYNYKFYKSICMVSNKNIIVDASKSWQRLYCLNRSGLFNIKVIYLHRAGRGVIYSYYKKNRNNTIGINKCRNHILGSLYVKNKIESKNWLLVKYDELTKEPEKKLKNICDYIGVEYEQGMMEFTRHRHYCIGGNRMKQSTSNKIKIDDEWKTNMPINISMEYYVKTGWIYFLLFPFLDRMSLKH